MNANDNMRNSARQNETSNKGVLQPSPLLKLFEEELMDIYWAEKALTNAIPKMIENATTAELIEALENHLGQTQEQVNRVETVFEIIGKRATAKKCEAMAGLIKEGDEIVSECENGAMRDAGIITAAQKIEHYEIASYGSLCQFAETLGLTDAVEILEQTLNEEKKADEKLTEIAVSLVNEQALHEVE